VDNLLTVAYEVQMINDTINATQGLIDASYNLPLEDEVADKLVELNDTINTAGEYLDSIVFKLTETQTAIDAIPDVSQINATLNDLLAAMDNITFNSIDDSLGDVSNFIDALPDTEALILHLDEFYLLRVEMPCISGATKFITRANDSIMLIPPDIAAMTSMITGINSTVEDALSGIDSLKDVLRGVNDTLKLLPNASDFRSVIKDVEDAIETAR
jgi:hypothetical protein